MNKKEISQKDWIESGFLETGSTQEKDRLLEEGKKLMDRVLEQAERLKADNEILMQSCLQWREENENLRHQLDELNDLVLHYQVRCLQSESEFLSLKSRIMHHFHLKNDRELDEFLSEEKEASQSFLA